MSLKTLQYALWGLVAIAGGAFGGYFYINEVQKPQSQQLAGVQQIGGPFELTDHNGATITEAALNGSPSILFFGFTHCPEICPTTLSDISGWLDEAGDVGKNINSYFITVDPERDPPEVMKDYVTAFSDRITGVTGKPENITQVLRNYRVFANKVRLGDGDYTMDHTASVILLDSKGEFVSTISYGEVPSVAVDKLKLLAKRS
ncbi:MAG: SCO family protein [Hyphomicrobiales bacterium]